MDLYRAEPGPLGPEDLADALAFADAALMVVIDAHLARAVANDVVARRVRFVPEPEGS